MIPIKRKKSKSQLDLFKRICLFFIACICLYVCLRQTEEDDDQFQDMMQRQKDLKHEEAIQTKIAKIHHLNSTDPTLQTIDCNNLLSDYLAGRTMEMERDQYDKSYIARTTQEKGDKAFYVSTHSPDIDQARSVLFEKGLYYEKFLTKAIKDVFLQKQERESIFLDVGGNIGWFSLLARTYGARVYMFEPNVSNMIRFCESIRLNGWLHNSNSRHKDLVHPYMRAVSNQHGIESALFRVDGTNPGSFSLSNLRKNKNNYEKNVEGIVPLITLDALAKDQQWFDTRPSIGFMKVDVEGHEHAVIQGAQELLKARLVENIAMELKPNAKERESILQILVDAGYELCMHGMFYGPSIKVEKKYNDWKELNRDMKRKKIHENVWFRLSDL